MDRYGALFRATLRHDNDLLGRILAHVASRSGKMMRPLLVVLLAREAAGGPVPEASLQAAVALELLHTASLVHDDVVDGSAERRGRESVNALYGNQLAVLAGDFLLSLSLEQAAATGSLPAVEIIARLGGTLAAGEVRQAENVGRERLTEDDYFAVIGSKTAALFEACGRLGALTGGADAGGVERSARMGRIIGLCFQIRDDIFDYYPSDKLGKPTGADMAEGKLTLPVLHALGACPGPEMEALAARVKARTASDGEIARLVDFAKRAGGIDYARGRMEALAAEARALVGGFRSAEVAAALALYVDFVLAREF